VGGAAGAGERRGSGRLDRTAHRRAGKAGRAAALGDQCHHLAAQRLGVDPALGGDAAIGVRQPAVDADGVHHQPAAARRVRPDRHQHRADAAARTGPRQLGGGQLERAQPRLQLLHLIRRGALLRAVDGGGAVGAQERVSDVQGSHQLGPCGQFAERLAKPGPAIRRRRAADADHDPPGTRVEGRPDQLPGAPGVGAQRLRVAVGDPKRTHGLGDVDGG
jgi:hypothetical protein